MANTTPTTSEFRAAARMQRSSPQKAKLVLDLIKGKRVEAALNIVAFTQKRMAPVVEGVLRSAVQNAVYLSDERGLDIDVDNLVVKTAVANEGPRLKRLRPAPMGRAVRYQRRLTHIVITVAEKKADASASAAENTTAMTDAGRPARRPARKTAGKKATGKKAVAA